MKVRGSGFGSSGYRHSVRHPRLRWFRALGLIVIGGWLLAGCQLLGAGGGRYPDACAELGFSPTRCKAIVESKRDQLDIRQDQIAQVDILPPSGTDTATLGGQMVARVRFRLVDGKVSTHEFWCTGVGSASDRACRDDARITLYDGVDVDVPCPGPPTKPSPVGPAGCATPPPTPRPASLAHARPLIVPSLDVALDHVGHYEAKVGEAGLADGYLRARTARIAEDQPVDFWIDDGVRIDVRPVDPDRPPVGSRYRDPYDGVEPVDVFVVFDVVDVSPGATLEIRDLDVE